MATGVRLNMPWREARAVAREPGESLSASVDTTGWFWDVTGPVESPGEGEVIRRQVLGGLINDYRREAA